MLKKLLLVPFAALFVGFAANAQPLQTLTLQQPGMQGSGNQLSDIVEVNGRRNAGSVIASDALYGGIAGLAIGGGVALLNGGDNWGRDLAIGAGAGLIIGGIFGAVDVATSADRAYAPTSPRQEIGWSSGVSPLSGKF